MIIMRKATGTEQLRSVIETAIIKRRPVTISYVTESGRDIVRTMEPYALLTSSSGNVLIKTMDRESGDYRSFRLDRITHYTVGRNDRFRIKNPTNLKEVVMAKDEGAPISVKKAPEYRTVNGMAIRAGLRVLDYDRKTGTVGHEQFTRGGSCDPGGEYFDGWFQVVRDDGSTGLFNGERLLAL